MPFETDKSNGFKLDATELLKTGVYPEAFDRRIPFWETVDGVQYTEFGMRRKAGRDELVDLSDSPTSSTTPVRGITSVIEFDDKVAYIGDLDNIYSYRQSTGAVDTVGSGYNLIESSAGTLWSPGGATATIYFANFLSGSNLVILGINSTETQTAGNSITVAGIPFSTVDPNGTYTIVAANSLGSGRWQITYTVTDTTDEVYTNLASAVYTNNTIIGGGSDTTWDSDTTSWDENINQADLWDFESFGSFVVAASGSGFPVIKKGNVNFNKYYNDEVSGATITDGGTGYAIGDTLTSSYAGAGTGLTCTVTDISSDVITGIEITNFGSGYSDGDVLTLSGGGAATITVTVPDFDFTRVQSFEKQGPHMLAFNYSKADVDYFTSFAWSSADDLDTWQASAINTAGSLLIREANSEIICATQLGDGIAAYTENQMFIINYVGQPNIFGYRNALAGGVGAVSPKSVVTVGRNNYGLSRDGFFHTDGASVVMIGRDSGMNKYFRENASSTELGQVVGYHNVKENEVVWGVPIGSNKISMEIYYNYKTNQWGMRGSVITAYHERGIFNNTLSADQNAKFYSEGSSARLEYPVVSAVTKAHDLNNADRVKELTAMRVGKEGAGSPTVSVGWSSTIDAEPTYNDSFIVDETFKSFPLRTAGRYLTIKVESDGELDDWTITDMVMQGRFEGER